MTALRAYALCVFALGCTLVQAGLEEESARLLADLFDPSTGVDGGDSIVGGVNALNNEYPFAAALFGQGDTPGVGVTSTCTGSLIHPSVVLTAAHCIGTGIVTVNSWVYIGQTDLNGVPDGVRSFKVRASSVIKHPDYTGGGHDIALVILANPVGGLPLRIETSPDLTAENTNQNVLCIGYGQISYPNGPGARILQKIIEPLYPICECYQHFNWDDFISDAISSRQTCYHPPSTVHRVCFGDSGGPMITGTNPSEFKVRGVVSFGPGCNERVPDIYTRVSAYAGWIASLVPGGLSSRSPSTSVEHIGVGTTEWQSFPASAQGNRACKARGWLGGYNVNVAPAGSPFGAVCFSAGVADLVIATTTQLNSLSGDIRRAASLFCGSQASSVAAGVWTGEQDGTNREILCLEKGAAFLVDVLKTDLNDLSADRDQAGKLYALTVGFKFALDSGAETTTRKSYYLVGSREYTWDFGYASGLTNAVVEQDCLVNCPKTCLHRNLGNGICDSSCNIAACQFDRGDCSGGATPQPTSGTGSCASGCTNSMVGDGTCQAQCNNVECQLDGGDCSSVACDREACPSNWEGDNECDSRCNNAACGFDGGDCVAQCPGACNRANLGNGVCDAGCNSKACNFDNGDCVKSECLSSGCPLSWLRDNECDANCQSAACDFDKGDCATPPPTRPLPITRRCRRNRCPRAWIGDGECDPRCNTRACAFDRGDCARTRSP